MAWLSGLADKAENLLNKIDQNTAAVLSKDKNDSPVSQISEVTWIQDGFAKNMMDSLSMEITEHSASTQQTIDLETSIVNCEQWENISEGKYCSSSPSDPTNGIMRDTEENVIANTTKCDSLVEEKMNDTRVQPVQASGENKDEENDSKLLSTMSSMSKTVAKTLMKAETELKGQNVALVIPETDHQKQMICLKEKIASVEAEKLQLSMQVTDLMSGLEKSRQEVSNMRSELELHRARALKTLREKEKLIGELRCNTTKDTDDVTVMELNQIRQEREVLREENQVICKQLRAAREELVGADLKLEKMRQEIKEAGMQAQDILAIEKRKRMDAEEDARIHSEEIRSLKEELMRQRNGFALQMRKQESELSRLRLQLSATTTPSSEVESRLTTLTQTLVLKQQALEHLTTERNALRLQLEKLEHEYRNYVGNSGRNVSYNCGNDTDDAKAQIPMFMIETPFDTSVTRRVKRAYSSLDAISVRTGVFLRRYPLARILVLIYMALLQFWVLIVLLSQSPDAH